MGTVGFLGAGRMGSALLQSLLSAKKASAAELFFFEPDAPRAKSLAAETGATALPSLVETAKACDTLFVCVKPGLVASVLEECAKHLEARHRVVSIAAGVGLPALRQAAGTNPSAVVRVMPNTPALVASGVSAVSFEAGTPAATRASLLDLLGASGRTVEVSEKDMDAVTGLSGSGPAYVFVFIEALADAGVRMGLTRETALVLATETVRGAATLVAKTGAHPAVLKDQVASPGGTTIAGLEALEAHGFRNAAIQAVVAAAKRSKELGG